MIPAIDTASMPADLEAPPGEAADWIEGQLVSQLLASSWETQLALVLVLPVICVLLWAHVWLPGLVLWALAVLFVMSYRLMVVNRFRLRRPMASPEEKIAFLDRHGFVWPLSAALWSSLGFLYFGTAPLLSQFLCWLILACIGSFSVTSFAAHLPTLRSYLTTLVGMGMVVVAWHIGVKLQFAAPTEYYILLMLMLVYWWLLIQAGYKLHETLRASVQLQHANADLIQSLKQQTRTALEAVQTKNRFIASAAHDLRQPVHALSLYADWLGSEPEMAAELAPKIVQSTRAVNELFDALFDLVRLDAGKIKPQWQEVSLDALARELLVQYRPQADAKGVALRLRSVPVHVWSDPIMLRRILGNLLSNAVRHTQKGGILLAIRQRGHMVRVEVWDTGIGIAPEHQQMIFREFFRVPMHQGTEEGFGLGLSIVSRLAVALGHPLALQSRPGRGTMFRLSVPVSREPSAVQQAVGAGQMGSL